MAADDSTTEERGRKPLSPSTPRPRKVDAFTVDTAFKLHPVKLALGSERLYGCGVFSNVYVGHVVRPKDQKVAIKKAWPGQPEKDMRKDKEMHILHSLDHPNVIKLLYVFDQKPPADGEGFCRSKVFTFMETTVADFVKNRMAAKRPVEKLRCKLIGYQLLAGVAYIHEQKICHRDMKPQNLLYDSQTSLLKIADFGNAKRMDKPNVRSTAYQVTRFYRAPELCLSFDRYGLTIDVWAAACVIAEVIEGGQILFRGRDNRDQFLKIESLLGTPTSAEMDAMYPGHPSLGHKTIKGRGLGEGVRSATPYALHLLRALLQYAPLKRETAASALHYNYFDELRDPATKLENGMALPIPITPSRHSTTRQGAENASASVVAESNTETGDEATAPRTKKKFVTTTSSHC